ncbi:MAG TPA: GC-type dockerin domain-anchored protein, partial [Phycisphaerales bacterium]|nr:GC-type dockerin domain-anchored protein [Phycisphaerales bacterium]
GKGIRNAQGLPADADPGVPFDGANPGAAPPNNARPDVPAGDYYLLVCNGDDGVVFRAGLFNAEPTTEANTGPYSVMFRSWLTANTAPFDVPPSTDLGTIGGTVTQTADITAGRSFVWYKFTIPEEASDTSGKYVDIDTANTAAPMNDTNIALYDSAGALKSFNDDIAPGWGAENPTGGNSAMSFGMGATPRDYTAVNANLPQGDGRDGVLAAGDYYVQVSMCCANYNNDRFWVVNDYVTNPDVGDINVAIRTNYPPVGSTCGLADLGGTGGVPGFDNHLDNNDFVVFIDFFFAHNPLADQGSIGGVPGADGVWDNNDFVVYIDNFFNAPAACRS